MKSRLRLTLASIMLATMAAVALSCSNSDNKNPMNPGGGGADVTIAIVGELGANSFSPSPDTVTVGQTVAWKNNTGTTHTATANGGAFNTGNIGGGSTSAAIAMNTIGSFPYHCSIHNTMTGILVVKAAPPTVTISIVGDQGATSFSPNPDTVSVGQAVQWKNNDVTTHAPISDNGTTFSTGNILAGATSSAITMNAAGSFPYHCSIHTAMVGTLVVKP